MKKRLKEIALFMIPIFLIFVVFGGFFLLWKSASEGKTRNVELQELENGKYVFLPGGMSFSAIDDNGAVLWSYEDVTPITSFYPYENGVIVDGDNLDQRAYSNTRHLIEQNMANGDLSYWEDHYSLSK